MTFRHDMSEDIETIRSPADNSALPSGKWRLPISALRVEPALVVAATVAGLREYNEQYRIPPVRLVCSPEWYVLLRMGSKHVEASPKWFLFLGVFLELYEKAAFGAVFVG